MTCGGVLLTGRRRGEICGRPIVGFCAPGAGRCGKHVDSISERVAAIAKRRSIREMFALRDCPRPDDDQEDDEEPDRDQEPEPGPDFDVERFAGAALDE